MIPNVAALREAAGGLENLTDFEVLQAVHPAYSRYYPDFNGFAKAAGVDVGSLAGNRLSAGVDNYQANLWGFGEAVAGAVGADGAAGWLGERRVANENQARSAQQFAQTQGAVDDWRDVNGVGSGLNFVGGLAAQSLPYLGEAVAGAVVGGTTLPATLGRMGVSAGRVAGTARTLGAVGASYPSAVGDILQNQRDETGTTNIGAAFVGGVPYAAANAFGMEGLVARGLRPIANVEAGLARRMGVNAGLGALGDGASETFQEGVNQYFGRMAVNPGQTMFNDEANKRYIDSFVGGAALGLGAGGLSGIRRPRVEDQPNLLDRGGEYTPPSNGSLFGELEVPPQFSPVNGPIAEPQDLGAKYAELSSALERIESGMAQAEQSGNTKLFYELASVRNRLASELAPIADQVTRQEAMNAGPQMGLFSQGDSVTRGVQPAARPNYMQADMFGNVAATQEDIDRQNDPGAVMARQMWAEKQTSPAAPVGTTGKRAGATQPTQADPAVTAAYSDLVGEKKPDGSPAVTLKPQVLKAHAQLVEMRDAGYMTPDAFNQTVTALREAVQNDDTKGKNGIQAIVKRTRENHTAFKSQSSVQPVATATAPVGTQSPATQAATTGPQTGAGPVAKAGTAVGSANTGAVGRETKALWEQLRQKNTWMPPADSLTAEQAAKAEDLAKKGWLTAPAARTITGIQEVKRDTTESKMVVGQTAESKRVSKLSLDSYVNEQFVADKAALAEAGNDVKAVKSISDLVALKNKLNPDTPTTVDAYVASKKAQWDAAKSGKDVVQNADVKVEIVAQDAGSKRTVDEVESEAAVEFRKGFASALNKMPDTDRALVEAWFGVTQNEDGELETAPIVSGTTLGKGLFNTKKGEMGITKQMVAKRIKAILKEAGAPADASAKKMRERLGFQISGTDLDTMERNMDEDVNDTTDGQDTVENTATGESAEDNTKDTSPSYEMDLDNLDAEERVAERINLMDERTRFVARVETQPAGRQAAMDWNEQKSEDVPEYSSLTIKQKYNWLRALVDLQQQEKQNDPEALRDAQRRIENEVLRENGAASTVPGSLGQANGPTGQENRGIQQNGGQEGAASGVKSAPPPTVAVKKKRLVSAPAQDEAPSQANKPAGKLTLRKKPDVADVEVKFSKAAPAAKPDTPEIKAQRAKVEKYKQLLACLTS